jgi:hypothetical protein
MSNGSPVRYIGWQNRGKPASEVRAAKLLNQILEILPQMEFRKNIFRCRRAPERSVECTKFRICKETLQEYSD